MDIDEFLLWCLDQEDRYELVDGVPVMMAGASESHDAIVVNLIADLKPKLKGKPCRITTADIAVRTKLRGARRPVVMVDCSDVPAAADRYDAAEPRMFIEVMSSSNEGLDWQRKLEQYRRHPAIAYILLTESHYQAATLLTRHGDGWISTDADRLGDTFERPEIGCNLAMSAIHDGLDLPPLPKTGSSGRTRRAAKSP